MTLLASRFLTPYEVTEDIGFSLSVPVLLSIWLLFLTSALTLTRKSGCDIKLLSNLVKLLQMFCVCVTSFLVCQSLCLYLACYIISVTPNYSESLKKVKFNWGPKILFVGGDLGPLRTSCNSSTSLNFAFSSLFLVSNQQ